MKFDAYLGGGDNPYYAINLQGDDLDIEWGYPNVGTCGHSIDKIHIDVMRAASIPPISLGYDLEDEKWVIYERDENYDLREVARLEVRDLE